MSNYKVLVWQNRDGEKPVAKWMKSLRKEDQIYLADIFRDLATDGPFSRPKVFKHLEGELWEIKDKRSPGPGFRIYFGFNGAQIVCLVVHAGSKKSQERDIELAKKRLKNEV